MGCNIHMRNEINFLKNINLIMEMKFFNPMVDCDGKKNIVVLRKLLLNLLLRMCIILIHLELKCAQ
jgi:hypothetical protein